MNRRVLAWLLVALAAVLAQFWLPRTAPCHRDAPRGLGALLLQFRPLVAGLMLGDLIVRGRAQDFTALDRARRILALYPEPPEQRDFIAYYLAFSVSLGESDDERRKLWVRAAAELYQEGLQRDDDPILHSGLGLVYREKAFAFAPPVDPLVEAARHFVRAAELAADTTYAEYGAASILALLQRGTAQDRACAAACARRLLASAAFAACEREHPSDLRRRLEAIGR
ncbi:MAG: hypothetical protein U1E76_05485 [Planctomycetota bacterium]